MRANPMLRSTGVVTVRKTRPAYSAIRLASTEPVVLTCEHATNRVPLVSRLQPEERRILATHWGWDIGAWRLTRELSRTLATSAIGGVCSRLVVDLNRRVDDPTLIRERAGDVRLSWNRRLSLGERERRVLEYHAPYHEAVDRLIIRRLVRGVRPLLLAVHTFTPRFDGEVRNFDAGVLYERDRGLARRLGRELREGGLTVRYNQPYSGMAGMMYSVDRHGKHHGLPCLEIELNQESFSRARAAVELGRIVARGVRALLAAMAR
jgi:predicted N-formylglutamate amidohydrolase